MHGQNPSSRRDQVSPMRRAANHGNTLGDDGLLAPVVGVVKTGTCPNAPQSWPWGQLHAVGSISMPVALRIKADACSPQRPDCSAFKMRLVTRSRLGPGCDRRADPGYIGPARDRSAMKAEGGKDDGGREQRLHEHRDDLLAVSSGPAVGEEMPEGMGDSRGRTVGDRPPCLASELRAHRAPQVESTYDGAVGRYTDAKQKVEEHKERKRDGRVETIVGPARGRQSGRTPLLHGHHGASGLRRGDRIDAQGKLDAPLSRYFRPHHWLDGHRVLRRVDGHGE